MQLFVVGLVVIFVGKVWVDLLFLVDEEVQVFLVYVSFELGVCLVWYMYFVGQ